jgi:hypothetical protein
MNTSVLLSSTYLPSIQFFSKLLLYEKIIIEKHEFYVKQSYRNRCSIYGANGKLDLTIPLQHSSERTITLEKKISYNDNWQHLHWMSICSAYRSSPYFEYFEQDFEKFYTNKYEFLFDFNLELLQLICNLLKMKTRFYFTEAFEKTTQEIDDLRIFFSPKNDFLDDKKFYSTNYYQVFSIKYGFIPNLSIIDLLFNEGLKTLDILAAKPIKF